MHRDSNLSFHRVDTFFNRSSTTIVRFIQTIAPPLRFAPFIEYNLFLPFPVLSTINSYTTHQPFAY